LTRGAVAITVLAGLGYGVARWKFFRQHSMSLEEVREEYKQDEGDPHVKSARKHEHEALVMGEIERRVKKAKVIVVRKMPVQ
jgi:flagellar biosynthesis protein FlhB